jgi:hypothetical protein
VSHIIGSSSTRYVACIALLVMTVVLQPLSAGPAAAVNCGNNTKPQINWTTYIQNDPPQPRAAEGVLALIGDRPGYSLCTTDLGLAHFVTDYTMVFDHHQPGGGWVQSGTYLRFVDGYCVRRWSQNSKDGEGHNDFFLGGCSQPFESHYYWQQALYVNGQWHIRSNIDQTVIHQATWDPFAEWHAPFYVSYSAEAGYPQDSIPGSFFFPVLMSDMQVQDLSNNNWYSTCGSVNLAVAWGNKPKWQTAAPSCNTVSFWSQ